jgi:hypothetical protein
VTARKYVLEPRQQRCRELAARAGVRFAGRPADPVPDVPTSRLSRGADTMELKEWSFTFRKIDVVVDVDGQTKFSDDWVTRP